MYLGYPKTKFRRELFKIFLGQFVIFSLFLSAMLLRSEDDFLNQREYCGEILDYSYSGKRRTLTWRLTISPRFYEKVFIMERKYIQNVIQKDNMVEGKSICVSYIPMIVNTDSSFITQITLEGDDILNETEVLFEYLHPDINFYLYSQIILLFLSFFSLIRKGRRTG